MKRVCTIAGSDNGGGACIQADLKTFDHLKFLKGKHFGGVRMRQIFTLLTLILAGGSMLTAQTRIEGTIKDNETQKPLQGVNVVLEGTQLGAATDRNGEFVIINVPAGSYLLEVSHIGYRDTSRTVRASGGLRRLNIELSPTALVAPQVIIEPTRAKERETPVTFSSLSKEDLEYRDQTKDIPLMLSDLPSTKTYSETGTGIGYSYLNIRGFDQRRISVLINGIPQNDPEDHNVYWIDFYDLIGSLKDIQVQRGAGTAFYGPAAIGGSINLVTQNYSRKSRLQLQTEYGSYNTRKASLEGSTGLMGDHWIGYGRLTRITSDNYRDWSWMDFWRYFGGIGYFSKSQILKIQTYGGPQRDGLAYYGIPKDYIQNRALRTTNYSGATQDQEWFNQPHYEILHQWQMNDHLTMNNTLYYIRGYGYFDYDGSWAPPSYYRLPEETFLPGDWADSLGTISMASNTMIRAYVDNQQVGFLHKYSWDHANGNLTAGFSLRAHQSYHWGRLQQSDGLVLADTLNGTSQTLSLGKQYVGADGNKYYRYNAGKTIASIFAHESYALAPNTTLLADIQLTRKQYRFWNEKYLNHTFDLPYYFINPRVGVNVNFSAAWNGYINLSRTTREPRLKNYYDAAEASQPSYWGPVTPQFEQNPDGSYDYADPLVHPETLYDFELGAGYRTAGVRLNGNIYYMDFRNEIVKNGQLDRFGQPITGNAQRTRHYGVELSGEVQLLPHFRISGNASLSKNEFVKFTSFGWEASQNLNGNTLSGFPGVLANLRLQYTPSQLFTILEGKYVGKQYTTNLEDQGPAVDPYTVWNARLGYRVPVNGTELRVSLSVNNLFDALYATHGEGADFFPGAPRNFSLGLQYTL